MENHDGAIDWADWIDPPEDYDYDEDAEFLAALENEQLWDAVEEPILND